MYFSLIFLYSHFTVETRGDNHSELKNIFPTDYDKFKAPAIMDGKNGPVIVDCSFLPLTIVEFSAKKMDMTLDMVFEMSWIDDRLLNNFSSKLKAEVIELPKSIAGDLWSPPVYLDDCKQCRESIIDGETDDFDYRKKNNQIAVWVRQNSAVVCRFDMSSYPFDNQTCNVQLSYAKHKNNNFKLNCEISKEFQLYDVNMPPDFILTDVSTSNCSYWKHKNFIYCFSFDIKARRVSTRPILLIFVPSMLIVIISWISFWLDPTAAAPRVALGLTAILTLATHFNAAQRDLPAVSTIMALDVWMFSCIFTVFASLVEFAIVNYVYHAERSGTVFVQGRQPKVENNVMTCLQLRAVKLFLSHNVSSSKIDATARKIFPIFFLIFNLFFWCFYCK